MMATRSSTERNKPDNQNLTRTRSIGPKPKPVPSSNADGSGRKPVEKPLPNYLKPTASSRPDPVKFLRKNKAVEDNQKLLRRRSFDRPLSSSSTSSTRKSLNTSPPVRPRETPVTGLRSTSFHGSSRGGLRGSTTVKSPLVASRGPPGVKKSGLSGTSSSKSRKEGSENVPKKSLGKEITLECSLPAPAHEDEEEIVKVEIDVQVSDHIEEPKQEDNDKVAQLKIEEGELNNEKQTEDEEKELVNTQENYSEDKEVVNYEEKSEIDVTPDMKEAENVEETKKMVEEEVIKEESESSKVKEGTTETKKEVVKGKKGSPTAYNDVIASKMQESSRKNKVLALAGAFQTVIDYETAASK